MGQSLRFVAILAAATSAGATSSALADSRIFTAQSSLPNVTIEKAVRNGKELAIVGRGDGTTLFRIESPSTPVGCANRIAFFTSTGERIDQTTDMCAVNWSVTVQVKQAAAPEKDEPAKEQVAVPAVPATGKDDDTTDPALLSQEITVSTDDPTATILSVKLDGDPVKITSRKGRSVVFELDGTADGITCDREIGLTLSTGREVTRKTNICLNDWTVVVALAGKDDDIVVLDTAKPRQPIPPAPDPALIWTYSGFDEGASLIYGVPQTDASALVAECTRQSGEVAVTLVDGGPPDLAAGQSISVNFTAGDFSQTYTATGTPVGDAGGVSLPRVEVNTGDPLWPAIIRESSLAVTVGDEGGVLMSLSGSSGPTRKFVAACSQPAVIRPLATQPAPQRQQAGGGVVTGNYFCADGRAITVNYHGDAQTAVLFEPGGPPVTLYWSPNASQPRYTDGEARLVLREEGEIAWSRFGNRPTFCVTR